MTIKEILNNGIRILKSNNIEEPILKSRLLLQFILNKPREYLIIYDNSQITLDEEEIYLQSINRIIKGEPIQHITKNQEFMKMNFFVNENVLIPRPDTEILVQEVIKIAEKYENPQILDLCTGSGAIAVSLAKYINNAKIYASDISSKALEVAKTNAKNNEVQDKITFYESNLFENLPKMKFDIIVSNPPYIRKSVIEHLNKEVQKEPIIALDGGQDGLDFYRKIVKDGYEYLKYGSYLCFEIGYDQNDDVIEIIKNENKYISTYGKKDLCGNDRIIITRIGD